MVRLSLSPSDEGNSMKVLRLGLWCECSHS